MTPFAILSRLAGMSQREAAEFHRVRLDTVKAWSIGRVKTPEGVIAELADLIERQGAAAAQALRVKGKPAVLTEPADDAEAKALGWPCVSAWGRWRPE